MGACELLERLKAAGVELKADGNRLKFRPVDAVGPEIVRELRVYKPELLAILRNTDTTDTDTTPRNRSETAVVSVTVPRFTATAGLAELVAWFQANRERLPRKPFRLTPWAFVREPERFYQSIERDVTRGPSGPRARFGGLHADLLALREAVAGRPSD